MPYPHHALMYVTWVDSQLHPKWIGVPVTQADLEALAVTEARSVGWIIFESPREIALAQSLSADGDYSMITAIPRAAIIRMEPLSVDLAADGDRTTEEDRKLNEWRARR